MERGKELSSGVVQLHVGLRVNRHTGHIQINFCELLLLLLLLLEMLVVVMLVVLLMS